MCEEKWSRSWSRSSEPARGDSETEVSDLILSSDKSDSSEGKPSDEKIVASLASAREEIKRAEKLVRSPKNALTCALGAISALERRCAALEKESRKTVRSPETDQSVAQKISELRESLEDQSPQGDKSSSPKGEEYFLVAPIKGVDEGRLILGDQKILSASALKI